MIDTILFDLDGTLVHHGNALMPPVLAEWGYPRSYDQVKEAVAKSIHHFYNHIAQAEEQHWVDELYREFYNLTLQQLAIPDPENSRSRALQAFFETNPVPPLFDDVTPVLETLHAQGRRLGVITQRGRTGADRFLREHDLARFFGVVVAGDDGYGRKPGAGPFQRALGVLSRQPEGAVYIGDRIDDDCEGARGAGLHHAFLIDREGVFQLEAAQREDFSYLTDMGQLLTHLGELEQG